MAFRVLTGNIKAASRVCHAVEQRLLLQRFDVSTAIRLDKVAASCYVVRMQR